MKSQIYILGIFMIKIFLKNYPNPKPLLKLNQDKLRY